MFDLTARKQLSTRPLNLQGFRGGLSPDGRFFAGKGQLFAAMSAGAGSFDGVRVSAGWQRITSCQSVRWANQPTVARIHSAIDVKVRVRPSTAASWAMFVARARRENRATLNV